jgi:hypothetical protein
MTEGKRFWSSRIRRLFIVGVAIIVLAPASVWMIAVFMRTYVVPPKVAVHRPTAAALQGLAEPQLTPIGLTARAVGTFPVAVASAGVPATIELPRPEPALKDARLDPVPLPPRKPHMLTTDARDAVPLPRPRPRPPL